MIAPQPSTPPHSTISTVDHPAHSRQPPELIPVRMLNEFTYCPRLGYLEFVHGEWEDNLETKQGTFGHRRVDKPDRQNIAVPNSNVSDSCIDSTNSAIATNTEIKLHARSILLSAPEEGLVAKLDLLEIDGRTATPVDYKRGKAPEIKEGAYEPERIQLCAQGLILRENGFECTEGVLYFIASKTRIVVPLTDELIQRTRQLREEFGFTAVQDIAPAPLVDSPKCPRCSLVGICLPDEVVHLKGHESLNSSPDSIQKSQLKSTLLPTGDDSQDDASPAKPNRSVRKLLPARDDATPFYVQNFGVMLGKSNGRLQVKKKGEILAERRLKDVSQVSLFGSVIVTSAALSELMARNISICHFSYGGWFHGITTGLVHKNVQLRIRQYEAAMDKDKAVLIARQLIAGKIRNCRTFLRRHLDSEHKSVLTQLDQYRRKAEKTTTLESLLGIEGMAAKDYFSGLFTLLRGRHEFDVQHRNRRPPKDPVNAVLSFAYALLTKELTIVLQSVGFDPMLGLLHQPRYGRPSLALDLAEEYRPLIADSVMLTAFNNGELSGSQFLERAGSVTLTSSGRAAVIAAFERRLNTEVTHPIFQYKLSYRRLLEVQTRLLARTLLGEIDQYPAFCTR